MHIYIELNKIFHGITFGGKHEHPEYQCFLLVGIEKDEKLHLSSGICKRLDGTVVAIDFSAFDAARKKLYFRRRTGSATKVVTIICSHYQMLTMNIAGLRSFHGNSLISQIWKNFSTD